MVIMSGCSSVTRSFNSSCLFVMLLIFSCRSVKSFLLWCDVVACECVVELSGQGGGGKFTILGAWVALNVSRFQYE